MKAYATLTTAPVVCLSGPGTHRPEPALCDAESLSLAQHQVAHGHPHVRQRHLGVAVGGVVVP